MLVTNFCKSIIGFLSFLFFFFFWSCTSSTVRSRLVHFLNSAHCCLLSIYYVSETVLSALLVCTTLFDPHIISLRQIVLSSLLTWEETWRPVLSQSHMWEGWALNSGTPESSLAATSHSWVLSYPSQCLCSLSSH